MIGSGLGSLLGGTCTNSFTQNTFTCTTSSTDSTANIWAGDTNFNQTPRPQDYFRTHKQRMMRAVSALALVAPGDINPADAVFDTDVFEVERFTPDAEDLFQDIISRVNWLEIDRDWKGQIRLPDGAQIKIDGSWVEVDDRYGEVLYKANTIREFNRFINASDLLEQFIRFCGTLGVNQSEFMSMPVELFINWLIIEAAKADGEEPPEDVIPMERHPALPAPRTTPRCRACGRFVTNAKVDAGIEFCDDTHVLVFMQRRGLAP